MGLTESWRLGRRISVCQRGFQLEDIMSSLKAKFAILAAGLMLSGCMQATTYEATNTANFKPRDKEYLAKIKYTNVPVAEPFRRAIVDYHRKEAPGLDRGRFRQSLSLLRAERRPGDPLRHHRRRRGHGLVRHRQGRQHDRMAAVASDARARSRASAFPPSWRRDRTIRWARARCICIRAARTRCSGSTAPTSRNISAHRSPRAASASPTRTRSTSIAA